MGFFVLHQNRDFLLTPKNLFGVNRQDDCEIFNDWKSFSPQGLELVSATVVPLA
jgi:hypothetical protein